MQHTVPQPAPQLHVVGAKLRAQLGPVIGFVLQPLGLQLGTEVMTHVPPPLLLLSVRRRPRVAPRLCFVGFAAACIADTHAAGTPGALAATLERRQVNALVASPLHRVTAARRHWGGRTTAFVLVDAAVAPNTAAHTSASRTRTEVFIETRWVCCKQQR